MLIDSPSTILQKGGKIYFLKICYKLIDKATTITSEKAAYR